MIKNKPDRYELDRLYWFHVMSLEDIAARFGCRADTVRQWMIQMDIPRRPPAKNVRKKFGPRYDYGIHKEKKNG